MEQNNRKLSALILGMLLVAVAAAACVESPPPVNKAPIARIGTPANQAVFDTGFIISFDGTGSRDPEKKALTFAWSFGDGQNGTGNRTTHSYASPGRYTVLLEVSDGKKRGTDRIELNITQANRAPVVAFSLVTYIGEELGFDASASTDADGDNLTTYWDFGDGTNGTGLKASHAYSKMGNFTVTGTVRDGKAERSGSLRVTVLPWAAILLDWNGTDYGYIIAPEEPIGLANLTVSVESSDGGTDPAASIQELEGGRFRATATVEPSRGAELTVIAWYWGLEIGYRTITVYENTPMPGRNCTVEFDAAMSRHSYTNGSDTWFNVSGGITVVVRELVGEYSLRFTGGTMENQETTENGDVRVGRMELVGGWFNQTLEAGMQTAKRMEMVMTGNVTTTNDTQGLVESLKAYQETVKVDHDTVFTCMTMEGTQMGSALKVTVETLGLVEYANGNGKRFPCIKLRYNYSVDTYMPNPPGAPLHIKYFREETRWNVQDDDHYTNTTIYSEWSMNIFLVNDTSGEWTLSQTVSGMGFEDSDGDGVFNPDPKPLSSDEAFTFHGFVPREFVAGDRITGANEHGVTVLLEAEDGGVRTVDGVDFAVILLKGTFSGADGRASGSSENWIVSEGNLTGLTLESAEQKRWEGESGVEDNQSSFTAVRIEEE